MSSLTVLNIKTSLEKSKERAKISLKISRNMFFEKILLEYLKYIEAQDHYNIMHFINFISTIIEKYNLPLTMRVKSFNDVQVVYFYFEDKKGISFSKEKEFTNTLLIIMIENYRISFFGYTPAYTEWIERIKQILKERGLILVKLIEKTHFLLYKIDNLPHFYFSINDEISNEVLPAAAFLNYSIAEENTSEKYRKIIESLFYK